MTETQSRIKGPDEIFCPSCGVPIKAAAVICVHCGVPVSSSFMTRPARPRNEVAVFVLGLLSLLLWPLGIISLALSVEGFREIQSGKVPSSGMFTAGRILSVVGMSFKVGVALLVLVAVLRG